MKNPDEPKKGLECDPLVLIRQLHADNCRLTDELYNAYNVQNEQLVRINQLEAELEDMTTRYKIADDCAKKKGEMNEKLYAEISAVKAERDAAVAGLKSNCVCPECKYFSDDIQDPCRGCKHTDSKFEWRGVQKEE